MLLNVRQYQYTDCTLAVQRAGLSKHLYPPKTEARYGYSTVTTNRSISPSILPLISPEK